MLLFDNAKSHTAKSVLSTIKESGNSYVLNIPYNLQTNPIESYFSQLKHYMKLDSKITFDDSLVNSMNKISKENCKNYLYYSLDKTKLKKRIRYEQSSFVILSLLSIIFKIDL